MKTEMDIMKMDERQRICWLQANRVTLMAAGLAWLGVIAFEISQGREPWLMVALIPILAAVRFLYYSYCFRRTE